MINDDENLKNLYPFQYYTFSKLSNIEKSGFNFDDYSFRLEHDNELYFGNINGLICRHDMGYPLKLLKYLKEDPDTLKKRKITFLLPENYRDTIENLKGLRKFVLDIFDCPKFKEQITVKTYKIDNSDIINKIEELSIMPKFDVCIGNPPYTRGGKDTRPLYIEILSKIILNAKSIVWICPTQWVLGYSIKSKIINTFKENYLLSNYAHIVNPFKNTNMANLIGIYVFDNSKTKIDYDTVFFNQFSKPNLVKSILNKFKSYPKHLSDFNNKDNKYSFYVNAALIRGNIDQQTGKKKWDWTTLFGETQRKTFNKLLKDRTVYWNFNTEQECKNFVTENEYDVMEFAQFIGKPNSNIFLELTPWFDDYTSLRTEAEICKKLNLTEDEINYIHDEMKKFGWKAAPKK